MKILIVHNKYRQLGGEDTVVEQEMEAYKKLGHEVEFYITSNSKLSVIDIIFSVFNVFSALKLKNKIKEFSPDVIHFHNIVFKLTPAVFWIIPKRIKVYITVHNYRFLCPSGTLFYKGKINLESRTFFGLIKNVTRGIYQNSKVKTALLAFTYRFNFIIGSFKRIDKFIFLTPFAKEVHQEWRSSMFNKSVIKANFILSDLEFNHKERDIDLIFIGRFTIEKGIKDVISTLTQMTNLNIHLVGDGPLFEEIKEYCDKKQHITIHGSKSRNETLQLINRSKFLLFPSTWYEGMPMTIIEAYAHGVPVISRNIGAMGSMILNNETGFHYKSEHELNRILKGLNNYDFKSLSFLAYKEYTAKYSEDIALTNLKNLLNE